MRSTMAFFLLSLNLAACSDKPAISIQVFPAVLAVESQAPAGWQQVTFAGSGRAPAGTYFVRPDTLLTEWNILAAKPASQPDGSIGVAVRLNSYAVRKMEEFAGNPDHLLKPLAIRINGRWADFAPLLDRVGDRMILYGFTEQELEDLEKYLKNR